MEAAELWNCDNPSNGQRLSRKRALLTEAQVSSGFLVVAEIRRQRSVEMASVQDDVVVKTLPPNRADQSLGVWILPWTLRGRENLLHAERLDSQSNLSTVPAVSVADEIMGSLSVCERLHDLLCGPSPGRMLSHSLRRSCSRTINTNSTLIVIVGTVKKSVDTIWPIWLCRKVSMFG